jgi:hypothetical protein
MPVAAVFENIEDGLTVDELVDRLRSAFAWVISKTSGAEKSLLSAEIGGGLFNG